MEPSASHLPIDPDLEPDEQHPQELIHHHLTTVLLIAVGGAIGAGARFLLDQFLPNLAGEIPWTTMLTNVLGALALALVLVSFPVEVRWVRPLFGTGMLGGFTTFSAVAVDTEHLLRAGESFNAVFYPITSVLVSIAVVGLVFAVVRR